ncbi:MAG: SDR family oxidoreductase [Flavobacteriales bacterium]|nr:SDR family oxidoreductase [Flavobacteriales bacterium]
MKSQRAKVILVTGASSGIGRSVGVELANRGYRVYGTSRRNPTGFEEVGIHFIQMDVRDESQVHEAVQYVIEKEGRLDVVVNNAGLGMVGPVENTSDAEAREIFDTNVFGVLNMCRACIPQMRKQKNGYIINITSLAAQMGLPFRGIYSASKFAVEGYSESLSQEVTQFGIKVIIIEPGDFNTNINQTRKVTAQVDPAYQNQSAEILQQVCREVAHAPTPEAIGRRIASIIEMKHPALRYRVANLMQRFSLTLMRTLPGRVFEYLVMRHYKLK